MDTNCSFLKCLFSTPVWFSYKGVRVHHVGQPAIDLPSSAAQQLLAPRASKTMQWWASQGKRTWSWMRTLTLQKPEFVHQYTTAVITVKMPVIIISLNVTFSAHIELHHVYALPLPWRKSWSMDMQRPKTDETSNNLRWKPCGSNLCRKRAN